MIIAELQGGLGNQLFQYAAGRALAHKHDASLKLDTRSLDRSFRNYSLDDFRIRAEKATALDMLRVDWHEGVLRTLGPRGRALYGRFAAQREGRKTDPGYYDGILRNPATPLLANGVAAQRFFDFDEDFFNLPDRVILRGFWISYKYFDHIRPLLLNELAVKHELSGENLLLARRIQETQSVSLHVRRTDKVNDPEYFVTDLDFLRKSIAFFRELLGDAAQFYVFSDDIAWCRSNIKGPKLLFVDCNNDAQAFEDLRLMSLCRHNIIAESTFSWWGAYLNRNPDKIVLTPPAARYINKPNFSGKDILPPEWRVIR